MEEAMGCPVHIWAPLMALILPIVRSVKGFLFSRNVMVRTYQNLTMYLNKMAM